MTQDPSQVLLDDFNRWRAATAHQQKLQQERPYFKLPKLTAERRELLVTMQRWCETHGLDPRFWLYCLFVRNRWLYAPRWTLGYLTSETGLRWYRANARRVDDGLYRQRLAETNAVEPYDPNVHMSAEVEARKRRFAARQDPGGCMADAQHPTVPTLGFHPGSKVCQSCPQREPCGVRIRQAFPFDIVALREGKITREVAMLAAAVQRGRP